jgi:dolichyl-diphosphooligosaccharide--protein glycosyltransferase
LDEGKGWLRTHWRTAAVLVLIFGLSLFLRLYFVYGLAFPPPTVNCDSIYTPRFSGGSDSYYWDRAICYSFQSGRDLGADPMLNYPLGNQNPRPPLFPWFSLLVGRAIAPLFATAWQGVYFMFLLSAGLFGALTVFPAYALGKEAFGRKAGIIGALLLAISVGHLQRSQSTDADHDAFTLFFVVSSFYFFLRALRTVNRKRWVENWFRRDSILAGLRAFRNENRTSILYALLAGLSVTVIALAWQGWAYVSVILLVWFAAELFLGRFRNEDTMATWILFTIALLTPLLLALQWYAVRVQIRVWYDVPAYLFFAAFVLGLAFTVTRDYPWTLVIPSTLIAGVIGLGVGVVVNPALTSAFFTGAGYFVQTKVVTTIAEDQAPRLQIDVVGPLPPSAFATLERGAWDF